MDSLTVKAGSSVSDLEISKYEIIKQILSLGSLAEV